MIYWSLCLFIGFARRNLRSDHIASGAARDRKCDLSSLWDSWSVCPSLGGSLFAKRSEFLRLSPNSPVGRKGFSGRCKSLNGEIFESPVAARRLRRASRSVTAVEFTHEGYFVILARNLRKHPSRQRPRKRAGDWPSTLEKGLTWPDRERSCPET